MKVDTAKYTLKNKKTIDKVIIDCITSIYYNYNVTDKSGMNITIDEIYNQIIKQDEPKQQCCGMTSSGVRCARTEYKDGYCKTHYNKYSNKYSNMHSNKQDGKKVLIIDNETYYQNVDDDINNNIIFSYDKIQEEYIKCGVTINGEHIITSDPFELEVLLNQTL